MIKIEHIFLIAFSAVTFFIFMLNQTVFIIQPNQAGIIIRLGKIVNVVYSGIHVSIPFITKIVKYNLCKYIDTLPQQRVIVSDNAEVCVNGVIVYKVIDPIKAYIENADLNHTMETVAGAAIRSTLGSMTLDEILSGRSRINTLLLNAMKETASSGGISITSMEINEVTPTVEIIKSMSQQIAADRSARAQLSKATADRESKFLEAEAIERIGIANAVSANKMAQMIGKYGPEVSSFILIDKYIIALQKLAYSKNTKLVYIPDASSLKKSIDTSSFFEGLNLNNASSVLTTETEKENKTIKNS